MVRRAMLDMSARAAKCITTGGAALRSRPVIIHFLSEKFAVDSLHMYPLYFTHWFRKWNICCQKAALSGFIKNNPTVFPTHKSCICHSCFPLNSVFFEAPCNIILLFRVRAPLHSFVPNLNLLLPRPGQPLSQEAFHLFEVNLKSVCSLLKSRFHRRDASLIQNTDYQEFFMPQPGNNHLASELPLSGKTKTFYFHF